MTGHQAAAVRTPGKYKCKDPYRTTPSPTDLLVETALPLYAARQSRYGSGRPHLISPRGGLLNVPRRLPGSSRMGWKAVLMLMVLTIEVACGFEPLVTTVASFPPHLLLES